MLADAKPIPRHLGQTSVIDIDRKNKADANWKFGNNEAGGNHNQSNDTTAYAYGPIPKGSDEEGEL